MFSGRGMVFILYAPCVAVILHLNVWFRYDAFKWRCVSDVYVKNVEDPSSSISGLIRHDDTVLHEE